jgi:signal transduction histidine kinase
VVGQYCYKISHGQSKPCRSPYHECPIELVWETGKPTQVTHVHAYDTGGKKQKRYLDIIASPIIDHQGNITAIIELMRDVTEAKKKELKIAKLHETLQEKDKIRGELLRQIFSIQEEERKRIARELHDETSQTLASLATNLAAVANMLPNNVERAKAMLGKVQALSIDILDEMHKLIYELRPSLLDDLGFAAAVRWLVENKLGEAAIEVNFRITGQERRMSSQLEATLFRVTQEAINNIIKHACAKNVNIHLDFKKHAIRVHMQDDGRGFDVQEAISAKDRPRGLGLLGMKERVELINGKLTIRSHPGGNGTEINIEIPYSAIMPPTITTSSS